MPTFDEIAMIIARNREEFQKPGVLSVRPGYQFAGGWITKKPCIVVNVRLKGNVAAPDLLPEVVEGVSVDVRQASAQQIAAADGLPFSARPEHAVPEFRSEVRIGPAAPTEVEPQRAATKPQIAYSGPADATLERVDDVMTITCHASPDAGWPMLEGFLQATKKSLVVGLYDFTSGHILNTITDALQGTKKLTLVLDHPAPNPSRDQTDDETQAALDQSLHSRLAFAWALERSDPHASQWIFPNAYHIKVAVRDSQTFWLSSGNWNNSNQPDIDPIKDPDRARPVLSKADRDWHVIVDHATLAQTFESFVSHDLEVAVGAQAEDVTPAVDLDALEAPDVDASAPRKFFEPFVITNERVIVQPLLTPDNYAEHVLRLIQSATQSIFIQTQYIHPSDRDEDRRFSLIIEAVQQKISAGLNVRVICSQYETADWLERLQGTGFDTSVIKIQNRVHNKGIVVDSKVVMLGSHNWSADGVLRNRDASLILWHEGAARYFEQIFLHDWTNLAKQQVTDMQPVATSRLRSTVRTNGSKQITVNGISIDPAQQTNALLSANIIRPDSSGSNYILVQADRPLTPDDQRALAGTGAEILEFVTGNAYICHYLPDDLGPVRGLPFVRFANPYFSQFKVAPALLGMTAQPTVDILSVSPRTDLTRDSKEVDVVLHRNVNPEEVKNKIAQAAGVAPEQLSMGRGKVRLRVESSHLAALAALDEVRHIEEFKQPILMNNEAAKILNRDFASFDGAGQTIAVCDTGVDETHPAFQARIVAKYALGRVGLTNDPHGHGTHVVGSALGAGTFQAPAESPVALKGMAPGASLVMQSVLGPHGGLTGLPADLHDLFREPYSNNTARIHSNSWGTPAKGEYTQSCYEVDDFVWEHRDCVVIFAAGNDGADMDRDGRIDHGSIGSPATSKNCITVGATESFRPDFKLRYGEGWPERFPVDPIAGDYVADKPDGMAAFSSRGPTRDGRIKPDVVAPGTCILSTRSSLAQASKSFGVSPDPAFTFDTGTSMATPLVSGCVAAIRQAFVQSAGLQDPSAALIKAALINGAVAIAGQYTPPEADPTPNPSSGFGRVNLARSLPPYAGSDLHFFDEDTKLETGQVHAKLVIATKSRAKVTLTWTDLPGDTLQNDLDLVVFDGNGREYHGNLGATTLFDRANNVEQVSINCTVGAQIRVEVRAFRTLEPQPFALVIRFET